MLTLFLDREIPTPKKCSLFLDRETPQENIGLFLDRETTNSFCLLEFLDRETPEEVFFRNRTICVTTSLVDA